MGFQWCTLWAVFILQWSCLSLFVIGDWHHNNNTWGGVWGDKDIRCLSGYLLTSIDCLYLHHNTPLTSPHHRYIEQIYLSISLYINNWSDIVTYIIDLSHTLMWLSLKYFTSFEATSIRCTYNVHSLHCVSNSNILSQYSPTAARIFSYQLILTIPHTFIHTPYTHTHTYTYIYTRTYAHINLHARACKDINTLLVLVTSINSVFKFTANIPIDRSPVNLIT